MKVKICRLKNNTKRQTTKRDSTMMETTWDTKWPQTDTNNHKEKSNNHKETKQPQREIKQPQRDKSTTTRNQTTTKRQNNHNEKSNNHKETNQPQRNKPEREIKQPQSDTPNSRATSNTKVFNPVPAVYMPILALVDVQRSSHLISWGWFMLWLIRCIALQGVHYTTGQTTITFTALHFLCLHQLSQQTRQRSEHKQVFAFNLNADVKVGYL